MRVPILWMDARLRQFTVEFRSCFSKPQHRYLEIVLMALRELCRIPRPNVGSEPYIDNRLIRWHDRGAERPDPSPKGGWYG